eukprot:6205774-Pleurochrysis_carterae.AAC.9
MGGLVAARYGAGSAHRKISFEFDCIRCCYRHFCPSVNTQIDFTWYDKLILGVAAGTASSMWLYMAKGIHPVVPGWRATSAGAVTSIDLSTCAARHAVARPRWHRRRSGQMSAFF